MRERKHERRANECGKTIRERKIGLRALFFHMFYEILEVDFWKVGGVVIGAVEMWKAKCSTSRWEHCAKKGGLSPNFSTAKGSCEAGSAACDPEWGKFSTFPQVSTPISRGTAGRFPRPSTMWKAVEGVLTTGGLLHRFPHRPRQCTLRVELSNCYPQLFHRLSTL